MSGNDGSLVAAVRERLAQESGPVTPDRVAAALRDTGAVVGSAAADQVAEVLRAELLGAGPLQPLLDDPEVTDVVVNGPRQVWVERAGVLQPTEVDLGDAAAVRMLAVRLAATGGQRLDDARPTVDARLPDGTRLHAVLPPVADGCTLLSLRVVRHRPFTLADLVAGQTLAPGVDQVVEALIHARANLLISGATGTGKTTLLSTLLSLADPAERIVCIEESGELHPQHPHVVRLLVRRANVEGAGAITLEDLVRESLRMRPDRVVLGECRGPEVREVLGALNTGHDGGCTTVHANTAEDVPARLAALGALAGMSPHALATQAASALHAVIHLRREHGRRRVTEIAVVTHEPGSPVLGVQTAVLSPFGAEATVGPGWARLAERIGWGG
ncbi:TadA family conjugal transfer-associated ATPase [Cellulomonas sp. NPDC089187]|uniref:TadA family conjugal transfer-associated ATPase n=1 Tax=Cellulomonas sp. NPDC089187 TaxID=3154970 RepID=UPI00343A716E